jgi:AraC family transcriptional regulator
MVFLFDFWSMSFKYDGPGKEPGIVKLSEKRLAGICMKMSLAENKTGLLWKTFMPRRHELMAGNSGNLYSLQVYPKGYHTTFNPAKAFEKWAAMEISSSAIIPEGMEIFELPAGLYAVFNYKGLSTDTRIFQYIFTEWLPGSDYELDDRPHFEILGEKYRNGDPESEEEIWIPVATKP